MNDDEQEIIDDVEPTTEPTTEPDPITGETDVEDESEEFDEDMAEETPQDGDNTPDLRAVTELVTRTVQVDEIITDYSAESLAAYEAAGFTAYAVYDDGTEVQVPWSEVTEPPTLNDVISLEGLDVAMANNQHFWQRSTDPDQDGAGTGAFVTDDEQDDFLEAAADGFDDLSDQKPWHNLLMNSLGILLRTGLNNLVSITRSAIAFFDGEGNQAANVVASFGANGAQIGKSNSTHVMIDADSLDIEDGSSNVLATFGKDGFQVGATGESHLVGDYHSLQLVDKNGNEYFHVSDLRDRTGKATITDAFVGDGSTKRFKFSLQGDGSEVTVTVDGQSVGFGGSTTYVTLYEAPAQGATVLVTYRTADANAKAYTLGTRSASWSVGARSTVVGQQCAASGLYSYAEGEFSTSRGEASHAEGISTIASQPAAHAEGHATSATMTYAHAEGNGSTASGDSSHAEGNSTAAGVSSHAEGQSTHAYGNMSHAEGKNTTTTAQAEAAHAEGNGTTAWGMDSHAEGYKSVARGDVSHAEGYNSVAGGGVSHAEGATCEASGAASHAEGAQCVAGGDWSHAQNYHTLASSDKQTAIGKCNVADSADMYALIIGNGADDSNRSNALTVDWSGNVVAAGGIKFSGGTLGSAATHAHGDYALAGHTHSYLPLSGGTVTGDVDVTGNLDIQGGGTSSHSDTIDTDQSDSNVSANTYYPATGWIDRDGRYFAFIQAAAFTNGMTRLSLAARNLVNNSTRTDSYLTLDMLKNGTKKARFNGNVDIEGTITAPVSTAVTNISDVLTQTSTQAANWPITAVRFQTWGSIAALSITVTPTAAKSANYTNTLGTIVAGKRPCVQAGGAGTYLRGDIATGGSVALCAAKAMTANTAYTIGFMYLLA